MNKIELKIELAIEAPVISQSSEIGRFGVDTVMARDENDNFILPRKLVKGCLLQAWRELKDIDPNFGADIKGWLGSRTEDDDYTSERGLLRFENFVHAPRERDDVQFRIEIEETQQAVKKGSYQVIETPFAAGETVTFTGAIRYFADDAIADRIKNCVEKGLRWIGGLGALENVGFGRLKTVTVEESPSPRQPLDLTVGASTGAPTGWTLKINPQTPFCIAKKQLNGNLYESSSTIPGGAIKGALAETWHNFVGVGTASSNAAKFKELWEHFDKIRFTHAFPAKAGSLKRPVRFPFSLVKVEKRLLDVAFCEQARIFNNEKGETIAPSFQVDWKQHSDVEKQFGWTDIETRLEIHTAILNNRAKDESLYAYETIVPKNLNWYAAVYFDKVPENARGVVAEQLKTLLHAFGLDNLGKTKAFARVEILGENEIQPAVDSDNNLGSQNFWLVTLQTPAILCDPRPLDEMSGRAELETEYKKAWAEISQTVSGDESSRTLELVRYFAAQTLAGGRYLHNRFQKGKPYNPYLLTDAKSLFVLKALAGKENEARKKIEEWQRGGLPLPAWAKKLYERNGGNNGDYWENCPYLPENGYGEIAVNLDVHTTKRAC